MIYSSFPGNCAIYIESLSTLIIFTMTMIIIIMAIYYESKYSLNEITVLYFNQPVTAADLLSCEDGTVGTII